MLAQKKAEGEVKSRFTFKTGLKNLAADLIDSTTLSTKSWRWTPPAMGAAEGEGETTSHFISTRHSSDSLTVLFDGAGLKEWQHDPSEEEKDYMFTLPGGLGLSGMVTVTRLGSNKYEYNLDVPGEVMDLSEHWLTATVELDSIFIRKATVEDKESGSPYILYEVTTILRDRPEGPGHVTHKRFSEFDTLHKLVKSSFSAKLNKSKQFTMPSKPKKTLLKRFDEASCEKRRVELEAYLQALIRIPAIGSNPDVLRFLNVPLGGSSAGGSGGSGGGDGGYDEARLAEVSDMVASVSTADTQKGPPETLAGLARLAMTADEAMSKHLCAALAERLAMDEIPVKVKILHLLATLLGKGSPSFKQAAASACLALAEEACRFDKEDPEHGAKPAEMIRASAQKVTGTLRKVAAAAATTERQAMGASVVTVETAALPGEILRHLEAATEDSTAQAPLPAIDAILAFLTSSSAMGLGGDLKTTPTSQLSAAAQWLSAQLGGDAVPTAVKLKTLMLLEKLLPVLNQAEGGEAAPLIRTHCHDPCKQCLHYSKVDPKHGEKPAELVRTKAEAVLAMLGEPSAA